MGWHEINDIIESGFLEPAYDAEIDYIQKINQAKRVANSYFLHGRVMRELPH